MNVFENKKLCYNCGNTSAGGKRTSAAAAVAAARGVSFTTLPLSPAGTRVRANRNERWLGGPMLRAPGGRTRARIGL